MSTACSGPDPGQITFSERPHQGPDSTSGGTSGTASGGTSGSSGTSGTSGTSGGTDAGSSGASGGTKDPVFGTDTFTAGQPGSQDSTGGAGHQGATAPGATGVDCLTCHKAGGTAAGNPWTVGGTVYTTSAGTTPVGEGIEVRISDSTGKKLASAYTDKAGNFAIDPGTLATIPGGALVGVRDATHLHDMVSPPAVAGNCNSANGCHGSALRIYLQ